VSSTHECQDLRAVDAATAEGLLVVELQVVSTRTAATAIVTVGAPPSVTLVNNSPHGSRDVARAGRRVGLTKRLPGSSRPPEALCLQPFQLFGHGDLDHLGQISARHRRPHQGLKPRQLVAKIGASVEANDLRATAFCTPSSARSSVWTEFALRRGGFRSRLRAHVRVPGGFCSSLGQLVHTLLRGESSVWTEPRRSASCAPLGL